MAEGIVERAPAKLNLALHVRARRADGYHEIETLFAFVEHGDTIEVVVNEQSTMTITGRFGCDLPAPPDNIVMRAEDQFRTAFDIGARHNISLDKQLPVASGIGGGSSDAAATLRALGRLHGVPVEAMFEIADSLGSDVPACLLGRTAIGRGRGEQLEPVPGWQGTPVLLVNPGVAVSTAEVFRRWDGVDRGPLGPYPLEGRNDLEAPAREIEAVIGEVLELLAVQPGVRLARMSGSGATCFALFDAEGACELAAAAMHPDWWVQPTRLTT